MWHKDNTWRWDWREPASGDTHQEGKQGLPEVGIRSMYAWMDEDYVQSIHEELHSSKYQFQKLFGMCPYIEHFLMLQMHAWEMDYLHSLNHQG